ncbi:putative ribosome-binding factor A, mitochondrial [Tamandua tetradactyla]|uniref:putative ribosome-binding factor A, mitochondrial n=1 Tax=Tamandua tetradactyla TaxID=48850 RepID=UPI00405459EC
MWALRPRLGALLGGCDARRGLLPGGAWSLHCSAVSYGNKNLLKKFASKTRKKFWYEGPSLSSHFTYKPSKMEFLMKSTPQKTRKEDHMRLRTLNGLLHKALNDLLCTGQVSQELCSLHVELSKVSLTTDFSACRVYWKTTLSAEQNKRTEAVLQRSAACMRYLLMAQQTLRSVPPLVFVQDKENAALAEIDRLLAIADFGPPNEKGDFIQNDFRNAREPAEPWNLSGIDHEALNKQIMEYKRKKEKGPRGVSPAGPRLELLAGQTKKVKKKSWKARPAVGDDLSPRDYLLGAASDEDLQDPDEDSTLPE